MTTTAKNRFLEHYRYMAESSQPPSPKKQIASPPIVNGDAFADPIKSTRRSITVLDGGCLKQIFV